MDNISSKNLTGLKILMGAMSFGMLVLVILTSIKSDLFNLSPVVLNEPWFQVTLVDFYFNITIISAWVIYRERNWLRAVGWIVLFIILGSIATAFYVLLQILTLKPGQGLETVLLGNNRKNSRDE